MIHGIAFEFEFADEIDKIACEFEFVNEILIRGWLIASFLNLNLSMKFGFVDD